jgi:NAD(P)-dependent dehydrogenase (short-subunit alcohol dehydrogenase family)
VNRLVHDDLRGPLFPLGGWHVAIGFPIRSSSRLADDPAYGDVVSDVSVPRRKVLITGATDGLGRALALRLAEDPSADLLLHGRDRSRIESVAALVADRSGRAAPAVFVCDLSELAQVTRLASEVATEVDGLDVLVNNAGVGFGDRGEQIRETSIDGHELRFAVNHLAGFLLTLDLLASLRRAHGARVVFVASLGQAVIDLDDLMSEQHYDGVEAYRRSKLAQVMCANELAKRVAPDEVTFNSLHPATLMPTKIVTDIGLAPRDTVEDGVDATLRLVDDPALERRSGLFFDRHDLADPHPQAGDPEICAEVFRRSLELVGRDMATVEPSTSEQRW